ncbi:MAG: 2-oxoglutarate dehydrogenase E1 component [Acidobacteriota bacterium]|nr:2-oxoglutarate dehydrogenase E1 component [Acidobacteriota bacterium]
MAGWQDFEGINQGFVLELYERYQQDPHSVDPATRAVFERWAPPAAEPPPAAPAGAANLTAIVGAVNLAKAIRLYSHLAAQVDPLGGPPPGDPSLLPATHGVTDDELRALPASLVGGPAVEGAANAYEALVALRRVYASSIGYDFSHIFVPEERDWLRDAVESGRFRAPKMPIDANGLLDRLTQVEAFERFLHRTFPGKTRFSIEGLDMMVPMLDEAIGRACAGGAVRTVFIGMAHRGRLNVLAHIFRKPYAQILAEFKDPTRGTDPAWSGDVKYHSGAAYPDPATGATFIMPANPSHLEAVNPVLEGMARAAVTDATAPGAPRLDEALALPILIHGDAAFPGQGVVAETLNLSRLPGYRTGGTLHIIANNRLGFTARPEQSYSTSYASGLARGFKIPIVHVNADDPEACLEVARMAVAYRARFQRDFLIDLVGYRRYGHNEGDEPSFTQPLLYRKIATHPTVRERWARVLVDRGIVSAAWVAERNQQYLDRLQTVLESLKPEQDLIEPIPAPAPPAAARKARTAVPLETLAALNAAALAVPAGFSVHRKLEKQRERRHHLFDAPDDRTVDWASAEELAFASILADGVPIRLTGEDVQRGTFSQRHAVLHDVETGRPFTPLQAIPQARASFEIHDSPLSENAAIGFEYGLNVQAPDRLVIWEAQYGDFINGAQVMLDEFVTSARAKWGQKPSLVLLLPHGLEGTGPDHASARPERFLELAADINMRVANCTTAAQYFHLLRRQAALLHTDPLPLVVLTPKSLLRHPAVASTPRDLAEGSWQPVIDDAEARTRATEVRRLVLCSGKVYVDLVTSDRRREQPAVALCRVEQLYRFPLPEIEEVLRGYPNLTEVVWVQEEPENMGAWGFVRPQLTALTQDRWPLRYIGRPRSASPAEGWASRHAQNQAAIVEDAFRLGPHADQPRGGQRMAAVRASSQS